MLLTKLIAHKVDTISMGMGEFFFIKEKKVLNVNSNIILENSSFIVDFGEYYLVPNEDDTYLYIYDDKFNLIKTIKGYFPEMAIIKSDKFTYLMQIPNREEAVLRTHLRLSKDLNTREEETNYFSAYQNWVSVDTRDFFAKIKNVENDNQFDITIEDFESIFPNHIHFSRLRKDSLERKNIGFHKDENHFFIRWTYKGGVLYNSKGEVVWSKYDHFMNGTDDHEFLYYRTYQNLGEGKFDYQAGNVVKKMDLLTGEEVASFNLGAFSQAHYNSPTKITAGALNFVTDKYYVTIGDDSRILVFDKKTMDLIDYHQHRGAMITSYHGWIKILGDKIYILDYAQDLYEYEINRDYSQQLALDKANLV